MRESFTADSKIKIVNCARDVVYNVSAMTGVYESTTQRKLETSLVALIEAVIDDRIGVLNDDIA
jgi:hypothetical protein